MKFAYNTSVFVFALIVISCSGSKYTPVDIKTGDYSFSMSDSSGNTIAEGDMKIDTSAGGKVYGTYTFTHKYKSNYPGLNTMGGTFDGSYNKTDGMIHLNMNPKLADANVFVEARVYRNSIAGEWSFSTMKGVEATGHFVANGK
jgi:major membrane immunogen (membrane-anchored lipoprotein)